MNEFEFYKLAHSVSLHFKSEKYDCVKYAFKSSVSFSSFIKRKDKYFFGKWARKFPHKKDAFQFILANILAGKKWVGSYDLKCLSEHKGRTENLTYAFTSEIRSLILNAEKAGLAKWSEIANAGPGRHPLVFIEYIRGAVSKESMIILDYCTGLFARLHDSLRDDVLWEEASFVLRKYRLLFILSADKIEKYRKALEDVSNEVAFSLDI